METIFSRSDVLRPSIELIIVSSTVAILMCLLVIYKYRTRTIPINSWIFVAFIGLMLQRIFYYLEVLEQQERGMSIETISILATFSRYIVIYTIVLIAGISLIVLIHKEKKDKIENGLNEAIEEIESANGIEMQEFDEGE